MVAELPFDFLIVVVQTAGDKRTIEQQPNEKPTKKQQLDKSAGQKTPATTPKAASKAATPATQGSKQEPKAGEVSTGKKNVRRWENGFEIEELKMGRQLQHMLTMRACIERLEHVDCICIWRVHMESIERVHIESK